ncbi:hypothetical protein R80B4_00172 [Fibrobacteres bacterium R8-0-B4]
MNLYTIGFTKKSARQFFEILKANHIDLLLDVRLNNKSQLAGFTKGEDLSYFLSEICGASYIYGADFAPTKDILDTYKDKAISWGDYEKKYLEIIQERDSRNQICCKFVETYAQYKSIVLLCSEPTSEKCHRRLAAEAIIKANPDVCLKHL